MKEPPEGPPNRRVRESFDVPVSAVIAGALTVLSVVLYLLGVGL